VVDVRRDQGANPWHVEVRSSARQPLGDDVHYEGGLGPDIASPIATMTENAEPGAKEVARLNVDLKHPLRELGGRRRRCSWSRAVTAAVLPADEDSRQRGRRQGISRTPLTSGYSRPLTHALPEDASQSLYEQGKEKSIRLLYENMKQAATMQLIAEDKDLRERFVQNQRNKGNAVLGLPIKPVN
jgi:hypothetical protein